MRPSSCSRPRSSFRLLIIGETGSGKTGVTERILGSLLSFVDPGLVTVLDFAPNYRGVGRPLAVSGVGGERVRLVRPPRIFAPRLEGRSCEEVWLYARLNAEATSRALSEYLSRPTPVLFVNDLSVHLHAGDERLMLEALERSSFFVGNAYYGEKLRDACGLWERERKSIERLAEEVDLVWRL
ncbi:MAG: hypothetical protein QXU97_05695 [Fervidicoccaceae archaeon]